MCCLQQRHVLGWLAIAYGLKRFQEDNVDECIVIGYGP
jgi:hypothetical protein